MKRYFAIFILGSVIALLAFRLNAVKQDRERLKTNQRALLDSVTHYKTAAGKEAASVEALQLKVSELERYKADAAREIRSLGIRLRRVEATAAAATHTEIQIKVPLTDSMRRIRLENLHATADSVKARLNQEFAGRSLIAGQGFEWDDGHVRVRGLVTEDSVTCSVRSIDTLRQIVHRVPRRFLFIRWGTKAIRQEVISSNPHTRIVYAEYIEMRRRRK